MMPKIQYYKKLLLLLVIILLPEACLLASSSIIIDDLDKKIKVPRIKDNVYKVLNLISERSGYLFIYDSKIVDNQEIVRLNEGEYDIREAVKLATGNQEVEIKLVGRHALIYIPEKRAVGSNIEKDSLIITPKKDSVITVSGRLLDRGTGEPIPFATIYIEKSSYATISNLSGDFRLVYPDTLTTFMVKISHMGYISREIDYSLLNRQTPTIFLDQKVIPLQEIVVRVVDPLTSIREMLRKRDDNYSDIPTYITAFYREGVEYKKNITLTEAVIQIYKAPVSSFLVFDQAKLLKKRRVSKEFEKDTLVTKVRSSINSILMLDIVSNPPDFISPEFFQLYNYTHTDITTIDDRRVYKFSFEQKSNINEPLYKGDIYIDSESSALLKAQFEINPTYVAKSKDMLIMKRSKNIDLTPMKVEYNISYRNYNGKYYVSHVRSDLKFKVKRKKSLFSTPLNVWFEMVNCKIDTLNVKKFSPSEKISPRDILSDTEFEYDENFWGQFNVIIPEDKLKELINLYIFNSEQKTK
ncbi:MAG: carboxypeptidase-like regulatory domain-containing protein [Bacteroidales bacterium]